MKAARQNMKIFKGLLAVAWFMSAAVAGLLFTQMLSAFIDPSLHTPTLWAVNVYRFAWLELGLFTAGVTFGALLIYFIALIQMKADRQKYAKLIEDLKREGA